MTDHFDGIVIGGGFYGLRIALHLRTSCNMSSVLVLEKEPTLMNRASYVNQARVHNGYHYPRSLLTAYRSRVNRPGFLTDYSSAIVDDFEHFYAIAARGSKINARQFSLFCARIGAFVEPADPALSREFNSSMVEEVFRVHEPAFDARILRDITLDSVSEVGGITILTDTEALGIRREAGELKVRHSNGETTCSAAFNATYSRINTLRKGSGLAPVPVQHELTEMALVALDSPFRERGVTVMDGPFFSMMPFPDKGLHTLSHVRYTPHTRWRENASTTELVDPHQVLTNAVKSSNFGSMYADVVRYLPGLANMKYRDSIWEVKTVLAKSNLDDSRPILFRRDPELHGVATVMGGKIDNIYDVLEELSEAYG